MKLNLLMVLFCSLGVFVVDARKNDNNNDDDESDTSGSGEEYTATTKSSIVVRTNAKTITPKSRDKVTHPHHHHHHHHHRRHHHHHHHDEKKVAKKSETITSTTKRKTDSSEKEIDTKLIKKTVGELAQTPLSKLMTLFKKGGVRTDIADQTIALLNASIINQNDLAELYRKEEGMDESRTEMEKPAHRDPSYKSIRNLTQADLADISHLQESLPNKKSKGTKSKASGKASSKANVKHPDNADENKNNDENKSESEETDDKKREHKKETSREYDSLSLEDQRRLDMKDEPESKDATDDDDHVKGDKRTGSQIKDKEEKNTEKKRDKSTEKKDKKLRKHEIQKKDEIHNTTQVEYDIPRNIPMKCTKLVKNYANGEMTLKDYLKAMRLCKSNAEAQAKLADTTPAQREAVNTMSMIQHEAYKYAMESMRNFKSSSKDAESVMDQWRSNSFGNKAALKKSEIGVVPDAVKKFMTMQTPSPAVANLKPVPTVAGNVLNSKSQTPIMPDMTKLAIAKSIVNPKVTTLNIATSKESFAKSTLVTPQLQQMNPIVNDKSLLIKKNALLLKNGKIPVNVEEMLAKKSIIPQGPITSKDLLSKKSLIAQRKMFLPNSILNANLLAKKSLIQQKMLLQQMINKGLIDKNAINPALRGNARFSLPYKTLLNPANLPENIIEHPVPLPSEQTLIHADQIDKILPIDKKTLIAKEKLLTVNKLTELDKAQPDKLLLGGLSNTKGTVPTSLAAAVEKVKKSKKQDIPEIITSKIIKELAGKDKGLTPDKLAAEEFFASLANPVLDNMPVDTNLIAAFKGHTADNVLNDPGKLFQVSRRRRTLRRARLRRLHSIRSRKQRKYSKRSVDSASKSKSASHQRRTRHKRDTDYVLMLGKRDTTENLTTSVKPIERSNMGVHISSNQGPKLLDKIRDMSRVIIH